MPDEPTDDGREQGTAVGVGADGALREAFAAVVAPRLSADAANTAAAGGTGGPAEVDAAVRAAFALVADRRPGEPAVRVSTLAPADPTARPVTVVEVVAEDGPLVTASVAEEIRAEGARVARGVHARWGAERDADGRLRAIGPARPAERREQYSRGELDRALPPDAEARLAEGVRTTLAAVAAVSRDAAAMRATIEHEADAPGTPAETAALLRWLLADHFVVMGTRRYVIVTDGTGGAAVQAKGGLGILADVGSSRYAAPVPVGELPAHLRRRVDGQDVLAVTKTRRPAPLLARVPMDDISVTEVAPDGRVVGELRILGAFNANAEAESAASTPLLRRKLQQILDREDVVPGSDDEAALRSLFEAIPTDELFATPMPVLHRALIELRQAEERLEVRALFHPDPQAQGVSVLLAVPREAYSSVLRQRVQEHLRRRFGAAGVSADISLGDRPEALVRFRVAGTTLSPPLAVVHDEVVALCRTWDDEIAALLTERHGAGRAHELGRRLVDRLPGGYRLLTPASRAADDVDVLARLLGSSEQGQPEARSVGLHEAANGLWVVLHEIGTSADLSTVVPVLESLGLVVEQEHSFTLTTHDADPPASIDEFRVRPEPGTPPLDLEADGPRVAEAVRAALDGRAEVDGMNRLVTRAGLGWDDIAVLRAYRRYRLQAGSPYTSTTINDALVANPAIARRLVELFALRLDPAQAGVPGGHVESARVALFTECDAVERLDHDRILRGFAALVDATVRTNRWAPGGPPEQALALKFASAEVPGLPAPVPFREVFVSAPDLEGIHLRAGPVARGGIRWSDRVDDYRTEILDLMQAQVRKNSVIVPTGAKGGFVLRRRPAATDELKAEVRRVYERFIRGLLSVTDDVEGDAVVPPPGVRRQDGDDPYLVVAADRGTATFSDLANQLAIERGFWLGDAFASGGSHGYDHKELGITARGAWIAVQRHFRELDVDVQVDPITVVGIGDMSGDVFGNAMLRSSAIRLVAAFDHRHVFVDPDPVDGRACLEERRRLYELPGSSWADHDRTLISAGGGVWARSLKQIPISPEVRQRLRIDDGVEALTPAELIRAALRAPVDLLFAGGIGTFVKATGEDDESIGDRANDELRITADEVRARVVGEGANLALTQRARIQYARHGGHVNADAIDNSAGVDTSDHEVNAKILLRLAEDDGRLAGPEDRDDLLHAATDHIVADVLRNCFLQTRGLGAEVRASAADVTGYAELIEQLEADGLVDRVVDDLPDAAELETREGAGAGLTRPELSVLLSAAKRRLVGALLADAAGAAPGAAGIDQPVFTPALTGYFPPAWVERFGVDVLLRHRLRRELAATLVAKECVDRMGVPWAGARATDHVVPLAAVGVAWWMAVEITGARDRWAEVDALDATLAPAVVTEMLAAVAELVDAVATRLLTAGPAVVAAPTEAVARDREAFDRLAGALDGLGPEGRQRARARRAERLVDAGVSPALAARVAGLADLGVALDAAAVAAEDGGDVAALAATQLALREELGLDAVAGLLERVPGRDHWTRAALAGAAADLRELAAVAVRRRRAGSSPDPAAVARARAVIQEVESGTPSVASVSVAIRAVRAALG